MLTRYTYFLTLVVVLLWAGSASAQGLISLNLKDADLRSVIETIAAHTGRNFVIDPRVKGKVTVISDKEMNEDELYNLFLAILEVNNYTAVQANGIEKIVPLATAKQKPLPFSTGKEKNFSEEMVTRVIEVKNIPANELVPILRPLLPQQSHLAAHVSSNVLIIADTVANIDRLLSIVQRIDQKANEDFEVIRLHESSASEVVRVLSSFIKAQGKTAKAGKKQATFVADERTNSIMLSGSKTDRLRIRSIIAHLDTPLERQGNVKVIYLHYAKAKDLAPILQKVVSQAISTAAPGQTTRKTTGSSFVIEADEATNSLIVTGSLDAISSMQSVIRQLDIRRSQVLVEAIIAEVSNKNSVELGVQWQGISDVTGSGIAGRTSLGGTSISSVSANPLSGLGKGLSLGFFDGTRTLLGGAEFLNIGFLLRALSSDTGVNILSTPSLLTMDNKEAEIVVGQNVPFKTGSYTNSGTNDVNPFQTIERKDVGLTLNITPQVNEGDTISLEIKLEVSSVVNDAGTNDLVTNKRTVNTSVMVDDGETIVLGGLINEDYQDTEDRVPFLGELPLLGGLFRHTSKGLEKRNLMVFIRPTIVRNVQDGRTISNGKYRLLQRYEGAETKTDFETLSGQRERMFGGENDTVESLLPSLKTKQNMLSPGKALSVKTDKALVSKEPVYEDLFEFP